MQTVLKNVLIVDDEEVIRDICYRSLRSEGYNISLAVNGLKALEILRCENIEVVFSDYKMPMMDGIELLDAIKRDHAHVEVIIMTAFATIENAINAMKQGAYDFILKPVKPDRIRLAAEKCFEKLSLNKENVKLRLANQKLRELQAMKEKFIAITSHELRTPVSHLKGYLGILREEYACQLTAKEKEQCLDVLASATEDLENIVANMHDLNNISVGKLILQREKTDPGTIIRQSIASYKLIASKRNQQLKFSGKNQSCIVDIDRQRIKSVLNELIQNAIKFTPDGGEITVNMSYKNEYCVICIKDTGIGIAAAEQGKIFEKFYEIQSSNHHSSSKESFKGGGLGLGLNSVRAIVEAHGGSLKVKSSPGEGAEFLVFLPTVL